MEREKDQESGKRRAEIDHHEVKEDYDYIKEIGKSRELLGILRGEKNRVKIWKGTLSAPNAGQELDACLGAGVAQLRSRST